MLSDVPAMPKRLLELAMPVTREHVRQRLANRCPSRHRPREHRFGVSDVEANTTGVPPIEGEASTPISAHGIVDQPKLDRPVHEVP
jgi:hypothetical protein